MKRRGFQIVMNQSIILLKKRKIFFANDKKILINFFNRLNAKIHKILKPN